MHLILLWALVAIIGRVHCKCSLIPIVDDERSIAYACTHAGLNDLEEISNEAEWIEFTVSQLHHIPGNAFWRFNNLRRLSFYNCHVRFIDPDAFAGLERLEWLIFHGTKIHVARTAWFRPLVNLRKLIMDKCGLVHIEPDVFRQLPTIETLGLRDNDLGCLPIQELSYMRALRTVRLDGNPWLCECRQRLDEYLKGRSIVQEARCSTETNVCQCMTLIGFPDLPFSFATRHYNNFDRDRTRIPANELQTNVLTSLDKLPDETTWIEISGLVIDKLPRYAFFRFGNSLRSLDFNDCRIDTIENDAFAGLHRLQRLSMVGNRFPVVGAYWFRDLVNLQQLILQRNGIESFERTSLSRVGDSLRYLDIRNNRLRCIAVEELAELKKLEKLDAVGNPWLCSCRDDLQNFLARRIVGFEINVGRCYKRENEIPDVSSGRPVQQATINESTAITGEMHWTSFEDTIKQSNVTLTRPTTTFTDGGCSPDKTDASSYTCRAITSIEELGVIPPTVHTIRVIQSNIKKIPERGFSRFNGYLSRLELRDCSIESIEPRAFSNLDRLKYLSLRNNKLESIDAEMLHGLYNLKSLDVSRNNIYRIPNDAFDHLPHLATLDISENIINCIGIEYMVVRLRHLSSLRVSNNPWSCLCAIKIAEFLNERGIRYDKHSLLLKEDCYTTQIPESTVNPPTTSVVGSTNNDQTIEGSCVPREDATGLVYVCNGGNLMLLQSIPAEVASIVFQNGYLPRLPTGLFSRFTNLRELVIRNCGLTTVEQGAFQHGLDKLQNLTIQDNPLEMIGSSWFLLENLERLDLRGNSIDYIEPGAFRHLSRLSYLNLEGNDLRCIFTSDLNDMPNVYIVEFSGNPLKWRCRVELEQFLEARKIRFVKIQNSCEGLKLVRSLLLQNKTDGSFDCPSDCSMATNIGQYFLPLLLLPFLLTLIR